MSDAGDLIGAIGYDCMTGDRLSPEEQLFAAVCLLSPWMSSQARKGVDHLLDGASRAARYSSRDTSDSTSDPQGAATDPTYQTETDSPPYHGTGNCSFTPETAVATPDGATPIGDLESGDLVLAFDETTAMTGTFTITQVFSHTDPVVFDLTIDDEPITTTPNHPFYTPQGWTQAGMLQPGTRLWTASGRWGTVDSLQPRTDPQAMYNLTVATAHTFFVGDGQWLVHNECAGGGKAPHFVQPGTKVLQGVYVNDSGVHQPWKAYYDDYGRQIARTDYNAPNPKLGIPSTHHHLYEYGPGYGNLGKETAHIPREYISHE